VHFFVVVVVESKAKKRTETDQQCFAQARLLFILFSGSIRPKKSTT
jgi:hypothetical protein